MTLPTRDELELTELADAVLEKFGAIDILVNNAGATWGAPAEDHPIEGWDKLVNVNLTGAFLLSQQIAKRSQQQFIAQWQHTGALNGDIWVSTNRGAT